MDQPTSPDKIAGPPLLPTRSQMRTQYVNMLLALDDIPRMDNLLAKFFTWILLAGFVLFPGTFSSLQNRTAQLDETEAQILHKVKDVPLFVVAWICTGIGGAGMIWLWIKWRGNYIWTVNSIFMPGFLNSLAGIISTLSSVYGQQGHQFSSTSKSTISVTGIAAIICGGFIVVYNFMLAAVKRKHNEEVSRERAGKHGEGVDDGTSPSTGKSPV